MRTHFYPRDDTSEGSVAMDQEFNIEEYAVSLEELTANLVCLRNAMVRQQAELNRLAVATLPAINSEMLPI